MRVYVLKELPDNTDPGAIIDISEDKVRTLVLVGAVRYLTADEEAETADPSPEPQSRRRYRRRDMTPDT